jgi:2-isopropylmalate synthase
MSEQDRVIIFDTTLRDGEQSPGASMTKDEKVRIALMLERMNVDVIEAGFPIASVGDFEAVQAVARAVKSSIICGLSRACKGDIERAAEAVMPAERGRIHTFIATSPIHMEKKLNMSPDQVVEAAVAAVKLARNLVEDVEFSAEDAGRSEPEFLCRIVEAAINAGASTINIPDTVGYNTPRQYGELIRHLIENVPNSDKAIFSVHCHNDLGLAVANSLEAVTQGARQVECTINGLGERAGNASLEEVVMALRTREDFYNLRTHIDTTQIVPTSRLVSAITGFPIQPNKAIVGANAFAHESGIHQDGVIKNRETYEIMRAQDVGWENNKIVLGKHSGRNAVKTRMQEIGIVLDGEEELNEVFRRFKALADKKHEIFDEDLQALVSQTESAAAVERYKYVSLKLTAETGEQAAASITVNVDGTELNAIGTGNGSVDATFKAIESVVKSGTSLTLYSVNSITDGTDAQGVVSVRLSKSGEIVNGSGTDADIVVASARAYIDALNNIGHPSVNAQHAV